MSEAMPCDQKQRELMKAIRVQEWQPIATAPKDGVTFVLLWWEYWCSRPVIGRFNLGRGFWDCTVSLSDEGAGPTHWMPLPDPPKESQLNDPL